MSKNNHSQLISLGKQTCVLDGRTIAYELKRSPRAKSVRFQVKPESGLTVVIPRWYRPEELPDLFKKHRRWIIDKLTKCRQRPINNGLKSGDKVPYLGRALPLVIQHNRAQFVSLRLETDKIVMELTPEMKDELAIMVLERWYRLQAERLIKKKVELLSAQLGLVYNRLSIRGQRTRWGSCSKKGNLGFNWKLILAPERIVDYVVVHELAHLKELNHGERFWKLVEKWCPQWRECKKWLRECGSLPNGPFQIGTLRKSD